MEKKPIAVNFTEVRENSDGSPSIVITYPNLHFQPGQLMEAAVYRDCIVITPISPQMTH